MAGIVEEPLTTAPLKIVSTYLSSICSNSSRIEKLRSLPELSLSKPLFKNSQALLIRELYIAMLKLYATGQYYVCLDMCRKLVEALVRYELNIPPTEDLRAIKKKLSSLSWQESMKAEAISIYELGNEAIHFQRDKLWDRASSFSSFTEEQVRERLASLPEDRRDSIVSAVRGVSGIDGLVLSTMARSIELANSVLSRA